MDIPQTYKTAAMCNIVSGAFIIILQLIWAMTLISSCVGVVALPLPMIAGAVGIWQVMVGVKMNGGERVPNAAMTSMVGAIVGFMSLSWLSTGLGIFAYLQLQADESVAYLEG